MEWTFQTGPVSHRVLGGVDVFYDYFNNQFYFGEDVGPLDLFAPVYGSPVAKGAVVYDATDTITQVGLYVQDQMKLFDKLTLVLGGRYDLAWHQQDDCLFNAVDRARRHGLHVPGGAPLPVHPGPGRLRELRHVLPAGDLRRPRERTVFEPETGEQVEGGIKVDMFGGRLTSTVSVYHLTRQNVTVDDPNNEGFSIQTGEQRSQGVEVSAQARIVDGWDVTAFYAYTDGEITEDTTFAVGNQLPNTPKHSAGLWTSWTFPSGPLKGLGAGAGFRYVGERPADLSNAVTLPDYVVVDAAVFYRRGRLSLDLNFKNVTNETYFNGNGSSFIFPGSPSRCSGGWAGASDGLTPRRRRPGRPRIVRRRPGSPSALQTLDDRGEHLDALRTRRMDEAERQVLDSDRLEGPHVRQDLVGVPDAGHLPHAAELEDRDPGRRADAGHPGPRLPGPR